MSTNAKNKTYNLSIEEENQMIEEKFQEVIDIYNNSNHRHKVEIIEKAFLLARKAHDGVRRKSGEPYILHPLAVARIVCEELGLGSTSIASALLHDVIEDTDYTADDLRTIFGDKVVQIVEGLTKIPADMFRGQKDVSAQAENFRKLFLTMNEDARIILIKIADRLHNMRTLDSMPPHKQLKIVGETLYIYAPIAHRLGLFAIKTELEELCFAIEHKNEYEDIKAKIAASEEERRKIFEDFSAPLHDSFKKMGLRYEIQSYVKSAYSIWSKMQEQKKSFEELHDLHAVRIVFESKPDISDKDICWSIYGRITDRYKIKDDSIRDMISSPKSNGYKALHITVMGPNGQWLEVQIRSHKMDDIAEMGLAAHWKYKNETYEEDSELEKWLDTIRDILEHPTSNSMDFLDTFKLNLYSKEIKVFTPKGETKILPANATVLDFAFYIHREIGASCIGAKVNGSLVPPQHVLMNGDQVEIIHSDIQKPSVEWLQLVTTGHARSLLNKVLEERRKKAIEEGERLVLSTFEKEQMMVTSERLDRVARHYKFAQREDFFAAIGAKQITLTSSLRKCIQEENGANIFGRLFRSSKENKPGEGERTTTQISEAIDKKKPYILREQNLIPNYLQATCCTPILGDTVLGFVEEGNTVVVHKRSCEIATRLKSSKGNTIVQTEWGDHPNTLFEVSLEIRGIDSMGILNAIIQYISEDVNRSITSINFSVTEGEFGGILKVLVRNTDDIRHLCDGLKKNPSIIRVTRI